MAARRAYPSTLGHPGAGALDGLSRSESPPLARVEGFNIAARDGYALPLRLCAPSHQALPVLLYFHGGDSADGTLAAAWSEIGKINKGAT